MPRKPSNPNRPDSANDPLGCLFDLLTYGLMVAAGLCVWVWIKAGEGDLPSIAAEMISIPAARWTAGIFFFLLLGAIACLRFWGLPLYRKMVEEDDPPESRLKPRQSKPKKKE